MSEPVRLALSLVAGIAIGLFYFGTLWLTLRYLPQSRHPALLALASFWVRLAVALVGFYVVMGDRWERIVVCMVGVLVARGLLIRRLGPHRTAPELPVK